MENNLYNKIIQLAEPLVKAQNLEIWGLDVKSGPRSLARLFVDLPLDILREAATAAKTDHSCAASPLPSANIDQCEEISRQLGLALDVEDCFSGPWVLEVSTPGLERKFYTLEQLIPYIGDILEVRLDSPRVCGGNDDKPRKSFRGILLAVDQDGFLLAPAQIAEDGTILREDMEPCHIPWLDARHVSRIHIFTRNCKPGKKPGRLKKG